MRILVVEDEAALAEALIENLQEQGYAVDYAADGQSASQLAEVNDYDLVVLDWSIPPPTGIELLARWRRLGLTFPVLMLTGNADLEHRVNGLDTGADDFLAKPFSFRELLARIRSLLRRREHSLLVSLQVGNLTLDPRAHRVTVGDEPISLSLKEFAILEYFLTRKGETVSREELAEHVWDDSFDPLSNVIDVTVFRLRKKIHRTGSGAVLETVKGIGYRLEEGLG